MFRHVFLALCLVFSLVPAVADELTAAPLAPSNLPDAPSAVRERSPDSFEFAAAAHRKPRELREADLAGATPHPELMGTPREPFHWKGLLLQSLAFDGLLNGTRIAFSTSEERKLLFNKPFWSDYWASLGQYNMRRWNDGDPIVMNYIGHPVEGAVAGYLEIQNNPRDRALQMGDERYWGSRVRALLWATAFSTQWEIGPIGEAGIFNQGGFTYPVHCQKNCSPTDPMTNNTGWVDFIITPVVGTLWLIGEDAIDKYLTDPAVRRHPGSGRYKVLRAAGNPSRSLATMLRGQYPWYRDYEHPSTYESDVIGQFNRAMEREPNEHIDFFAHYTALSVRRNKADCFGCRGLVTGSGLGVGVRLLRYLDFVTDVSYQPEASPLSSLNIGGSLVTGSFGLRSGYDGERFKLRATLAPGFASYSRAQDPATAAVPDPPIHRVANFQTTAAIEADMKLNQHFGVRVAVQDMLIRYKSPFRDPDGIGTPPYLNFLSHDNYINSTNWGVKMGPVLYF